MIKNYITQNIEFLLTKARLSQDDFGQLFDLNSGVVGNYVRRGSFPKIETIQKICQHFKITIDDFVNTPLSEKSFGRKVFISHSKGDELPNLVEPYVAPYGEPKSKYVELLEKSLGDKDKIIQGLELQIEHLRPKTKKNAG